MWAWFLLKKKPSSEVFLTQGTAELEKDLLVPRPSSTYGSPGTGSSRVIARRSQEAERKLSLLLTARASRTQDEAAGQMNTPYPKQARPFLIACLALWDWTLILHQYHGTLQPLVGVGQCPGVDSTPAYSCQSLSSLGLQEAPTHLPSWLSNSMASLPLGLLLLPSPPPLLEKGHRHKGRSKCLVCSGLCGIHSPAQHRVRVEHFLFLS